MDGIDLNAYIASQACGRTITKADPERASIQTSQFRLGLRLRDWWPARLSNARGAPVSDAEAKKVFDAWHRFHPQISWQMRRFDSGDVTEARSRSGRRMTYRGVQPGDDGVLPMFPLSRTNGVNFPIQGSGRDLLADALADLWPALDRFDGVHIVGLIHDEILIEVPRDQAEEIKAVALGAMTSDRLREKYLGDIPLTADAAIAENWGDAH